MFKRSLMYGSGLALAVPSAYILSSSQRRRQAFRMATFWKNSLPIYLHYRFTEWKVKNQSEEEKDAAFDALHERYAQQCYDDIIDMRGLYIKLGQIMTTRADYAPPAYLRAMEKLQDAVPAKRFSEIRDDVEKALGMPLDEVFGSIEDEVLGAATIGQVHGATLLDGTRVVIKYQYPEVEELFKEDLGTVKGFCNLLQPEFMPMLDEMERQFMTEFDFTREGWALEKIGNAVHANFSGVTIPTPYREYCSKRVCVMSRHDGIKLVDGINNYYEKIAAEQGKTLQELREEFKQEGLKTKKRGNPTALQMELYRTYLRSKTLTYNIFAGLWNGTFGFVLPNIGYMDSTLPLNHVQIIDKLLAVHGFEIFTNGCFNGDVHPGNVLIMPDNTITLIDYGQVKQLTHVERRQIAKVIVALASDDSETIVEEFVKSGFRTENMDPWVIERSCRFFFEDDTDPKLLTRKDGTMMNLQQVMEELNRIDKTTEFPEYSFMCIRTAMLIRGLASHLGMGVNVAQVWLPYAQAALKELEWLDDATHENHKLPQYH